MLICQMGMTAVPSLRNVARMSSDFIIMANTGSRVVSLPAPLSFYTTVSTWQSEGLLSAVNTPNQSPGETLPPNSWPLQSSQWSVRSDLCSSPPRTFLSIFLAVHTPNSGSSAVLPSLPGILFLQVVAQCLAPSRPSDFCSGVTLQLTHPIPYGL